MLFLAKGHYRIPQARRFTDKNVLDSTKLEIKYLEDETVVCHSTGLTVLRFLSSQGLNIKNLNVTRRSVLKQ